MKGVKLTKTVQNTISVGQMEDGQMAIIRKGPKVGTVVQRHYSNLICIGQPGGKGWSAMFPYKSTDPDDWTVEILPPGTTIEIL